MSLPGFAAEAALYRSRGHYRASRIGALRLASGEVHTALTAADDAKCSDCLEICAVTDAICSATAPATAVFTFGLGAGMLVACQKGAWDCVAYCHLPGRACCPNFCRPGKCCSRGETCVDDADPNAYGGCCPRGQPVCGGNCCTPGSSCCGNECCPPGWFCKNGHCSQFGEFGTGTPGTPPTTTAPIVCGSGEEACQTSPNHWVCCPPGKECCGPRGCQGTCVA